MTTKFISLSRMALIAVACVTAGYARAVPSESIVALYSGGTITWANTNQFKAASGNAMINAVPEVSIVGAVWTTLGAGANPAIFCTDVGAGGQVASKVYYVYYAAYPNGAATNYTHVVTYTPPFAEGYPDQPLTFNPPGGLPAETTQKAVFLGSYLTDGNGNMIPFERMGERVVLAPTLALGVAFATKTFNPGVGLRQTLGLSVQIPASASALLVDFRVTGPVGDAYVLDPTLNVEVCGAPRNQADLYTSGVTDVQYEQLRIKTLPLSGALTILTCAANTVIADYVGYIEPFPHLY